MPAARLCPHGVAVPIGGRCDRCRAEQRERYATTPQRRVRGSARWKRARAQAKRRDGCCQRCGSTSNLEVHHLVALEDAGDPFALSNLTTLCSACHHREGGGAPPRSRAPSTPFPSVSRSVRDQAAGEKIEDGASFVG
jgi:5-methylcytosine-specific restriction endonuclease McrA